jgi:DNA primase
MGRYTPPSTPEQLAERNQARADKLESLHTTLAEQVAALTGGHDWQRWLAVAARLPNYSLNNVLLIAAQRPQATAVAGFGAWKALGRQVDKGEKGIAILAPIVRRTHPGTAAGPLRPEDSRTDTATRAGLPTPGPEMPSDSTDARAGTGRAVSGFKVAYVFDVSQTSGRPLATQPAPALLAGQAPDGLWDALAAQVTERGFTLRRADCGEGVNGLTHYGQRTVTVRPDVDDAQAVKTLAHELAHVLLHDPTSPTAAAVPPLPTLAGLVPAGQTAVTQCRGRLEVEAESVAYLITASHGLDTGSYTFAYVAAWASSIDAATATNPDTIVQQTATRVLAAARTIQASLDITATTADPSDLAQAAEIPDVQAAARRGTAHTAALLQTATSTEQSAWQHAQQSTARAAAQQAVAEQAGRPRPSGQPINSARLAAVPAERLLHAHELAVAFYVARLRTGPDGQQARTILSARGMDVATADRTRLGYAPRAWTRLVDQLRTAGLTDPELLASGLAMTTSRSTLVDRFRDRIIFPVTDQAGRTVALLGRAVNDTATDRHGQPVAKYLNSPESSLYRKGELLYGLGSSRAALAGGARPVLVEGPMDVLAVGLADERGRTGGPGFVGIAPCGTALTAAQVGVLDRAAGGLAANGVVVAFDGDDAGRRAAVRAYDLLRQTGAWPHALDLPAGQDPAGVLQLHGPAGLHAALLSAAGRPLADLVIDERIDRYTDQLRWPEGQLAAGRAAAKAVVTLPPEQIPRQVVRLVARLHLPAAEVTGMLVDALTDSTRRVTEPLVRHEAPVQQPALPGGPATVGPLPNSSSLRVDRAPSAAQRARAGFPSPLHVAPATPDLSSNRPPSGPTAAPLRRHA